ncbi:hypothetical protein pb186bvf_014376 [Paramecium bursaria]
MQRHECMFCRTKSLQTSIQHTLYHKYAASQNYYYTKEMNEIMGKHRTKCVIKYVDLQQMDEEDEYLKRYYMIQEYGGKIHLLTEFYKFHKDLPRWVISRYVLGILNYYYDKRRKIEFFKIQKQIEYENRLNPQHPPKGIVGDRPIESESTPQSESSEPSQPVNVENILREISFSAQKQSATEISQIHRFPFDKSRQSSEIQQMISLLSIQASPQVSPRKKQQYGAEAQYQVFKKKNMAKKSLKLDDLALSLSSRIYQNPQEAKMPLSARYQSYSYKLIDQIQRQFMNKQHSQTTSREKKEDIKKKSINSKKSTHKFGEIKQLELKILKSLSEIEKNKSNKIVSLDSKALQKVLSKFSSNHTPRPHIKQDSFRYFSNSNSIFDKQSQNKTPKMLTPRLAKNLKLLIPHKSQDITNLLKKPNKSNASNHSQVKALDLKKLMMMKDIQTSSQTERTKKNIPTLNLGLIGITNQSSFTSRNNSYNPSSGYQLLTPKPHTSRYKSNTLMHWQVKAIQAAQREYNLNNLGK